MAVERVDGVRDTAPRVDLLARLLAARGACQRDQL
jgi:hypothetical protein